MEFLQMLASCGDADLLTILGIVRTVIKIIQFGIPIILIVLIIIDFAKAVVANDEKKMNETRQVAIKRIIYAVVIFLVPTIISLLFNLLPGSVFGSNVNGYSWKDCWTEAGK